jgi:hypothetical protein
MHHFLFVDLFFMTLIADFLSLRFEQVLRLGGVRIVARYATANLQGGMQMRLVHSHLFRLVTRVTQVIPPLLQDKFGNDAVPKVTILALLVLEGRMYVFHSEVFVREFRMAVQTGLAREFSPCRPGPGMEDDAAQEENRSENTDLLFCK